MNSSGSITVGYSEQVSNMRWVKVEASIDLGNVMDANERSNALDELRAFTRAVIAEEQERVRQERKKQYDAQAEKDAAAKF